MTGGYHKRFHHALAPQRCQCCEASERTLTKCPRCLRWVCALCNDNAPNPCDLCSLENA